MLHTHLAALALVAIALVASGCGKSSKTKASTTPAATVSTSTEATKTEPTKTEPVTTATSTPLTRTVLIAKSDAICKGVFRKRASLKSSTPQELASGATQLSAFEQTAFEELSKFVPPASLASDWKQIVAGAQATAAYTAKIAGYVLQSNGLNSPAARVLISANSMAENKVLAIAKHDGFHDCSIVV